MVKRIIITVVLLAILALVVLSTSGKAQVGWTRRSIVDNKFPYGPYGPYGVRVRLWADITQESLWVTNSKVLWDSIEVGQLCICLIDEFGLCTDASCRWPTYYYLPTIIKPHY